MSTKAYECKHCRARFFCGDTSSVDAEVMCLQCGSTDVEIMKAPAGMLRLVEAANSFETGIGSACG